MESAFLSLVNLSLNASYLVLAVLLLRVIFKKAPKRLNCLLWGLVGLRLVFPFSIESVMSLIPSAEVLDPQMVNRNYFDIDTGFRRVDRNVNMYLADRYFEGVTVPTNTSLNITRVLMLVWLIGVSVLLIYTLISYLRLRKRVSTATLLRDNIKESEFVSSPFVLGIIKPIIYLPYNMDEEERKYVIAHEKAHLKRFDHLIKPLGFLILTVYWFNPLMWLAYILLCRDIELACDEKVIKNLGEAERKSYSGALLNLSVSRRSIAACPLAFGEVGVKQRVKNALSYKKPAFWIIIIALILSAATAVCFLTVPKVYTVEEMYGSVPPDIQSVNIAGPAQTKYFDTKEEVEAIAGLISDIEVSRYEIKNRMTGPRNYMIRFNGEGDYYKTYYLDSRCTTIQVNNFVKPSYIYRVKNSEEIFEKLKLLLAEASLREEPTSPDEPVQVGEPKVGFNPHFNAEVLEVYKNSVLVKPLLYGDEFDIGAAFSDKIVLSLTAFPNNYPDLKAGDEIGVVFNGSVAETYPARIDTIFTIYFLSDIES